MKKILFFIMSCWLVGGVSGQSWNKLETVSEFNRRLAETALRTQSIECDFIQEKYLNVFTEKVISKGKFYFLCGNKISLSYTQPLDYLIIINGLQLKLVADGKTDIVDLGTNKMMNNMNKLLAACMTGNLELLKEGYQLEYLEDQSNYLVRITPQDQGVKAYLAEMSVFFDKKDMAVIKLRLSENAFDYTEYRFLNRKFNTLKDDEKFIIR